jgi:hypothetical protein
LSVAGPDPKTPEQRDDDASDRDIAAAVRDRLSDPDARSEQAARREAGQDRWAALQDRLEAERERRERNGDGSSAD